MIRSPSHSSLPSWWKIQLTAMFTDPNSVLLKDATLEQIVQAISAKIEAKDLTYTEEEVCDLNLDCPKL